MAQTRNIPKTALLVDQGDRLPLLASWMEGAKPDQLWNYPLRVDPRDPDPFESYSAVEETLVDLHSAAPGRLDGKRREFRSVRHASEMQGLQEELAFAARLARRGVAFDFGAAGVPLPDLVLRDSNLGIELTAKRTDALWDLRWHLMRRFTAVRPRVRLTLEFSALPHAIRTKVRDELTNEIASAVSCGDREVFAVVRPAAHGEPAITVRVLIGRGGGVNWPNLYVSGGEKRHELAIEDARRSIIGTMEDKRKKRQGESMPTLLLVDISGIRHARQWSDANWLRAMSSALLKQDVFVGLGVIRCSGWRPGGGVAIVENSHAAASSLSGLRELASLLGLRTVGETTPSVNPAPRLYDY